MKMLDISCWLISKKRAREKGRRSMLVVVRECGEEAEVLDGVLPSSELVQEIEQRKRIARHYSSFKQMWKRSGSPRRIQPREDEQKTTVSMWKWNK